jgi:hypothetical protein
VPGPGIGPISRGMTAAELYRILGNPIQIRGSELYIFSALAVAITDSSDRVSGVGTGDKKYSTREGLRVGSSALEVRAKLGRPDIVNQEGDLLCYNQGIWFTLDHAGIVEWVRISSPGCKYMYK